MNTSCTPKKHQIYTLTNIKRNRIYTHQEQYYKSCFISLLKRAGEPATRALLLNKLPRRADAMALQSTQRTQKMQRHGQGGLIVSSVFVPSGLTTGSFKISACAKHGNLSTLPYFAQRLQQRLPLLPASPFPSLGTEISLLPMLLRTLTSAGQKPTQQNTKRRSQARLAEVLRP